MTKGKPLRDPCFKCHAREAMYLTGHGRLCELCRDDQMTGMFIKQLMVARGRTRSRDKSARDRKPD